VCSLRTPQGRRFPATMGPMLRQTSGAVPDDCPRVLSVQSHVVHGYVGNRAAVFPLQLLGFEVDVINSVQFSCHTGYPAICGQKLDGKDLQVLVEGLAANEVLDHDYLLTGYIGTASFLREVVRLLDRLPKSCRYICDPVLGDNGKLYTSPELVDVYRAEVLPRVSILTPNQFEAELLTKSSITSVAEAAAACDALHSLGVATVFLTTLDVPDATKGGEFVYMMLSEPGRDKWLLQLPRIGGGPFTGTGDLTTAMLLAWTYVHPYEAPAALEKAGAVLQATIRETVRSHKGRTIGGKLVPPELRIISSKRAIEEPVVFTRCRLVVPLSPSPTGILFEVVGLRVDAGKPLAECALGPSDREFLLQLAARGVPVGFATADGDHAVVVELLDGRLAPARSADASGGPAAKRPRSSLEAGCCAAWGLELAALVVVADGVPSIERARTAGAVPVAWLPEGCASTVMRELAKAARFTVSSAEALSRLLPE